METIKLVIWDLDETFWGGTLSEGGIKVRPENHEIVLELSRRGVVNSICSKNDFDAARNSLVEQGVWDYFVFPKIDWNPKGQMIAETLEEMGLRAVNTLFIDDAPQNLEEVKFYNPGIQVASPEMISWVVSQPAAQGKSDPELSRLRQYQLLQKKVGDRKQLKTSNEEFLRNCQIQVDIRRDCEAVFDRLLEMIQRTNQLNFTKRHLDAQQLRQLIEDRACETAYLHVRDRYGDYGIAGFYALRGRRLEQFLFSCRILNMGVERWLYERLGRPELTIVGEVSDDPTTLNVPDWIEVAELGQPAESPPPVKSSKILRVLLKGGCDLEQIADLLTLKDIRISSEFNYVTASGSPVHNEHTEILKRCTSDVAQRYAAQIAKIPFLEERTYQTQFLSPDYDVYVYSPLMDMTNGLYRYGTSDWVIACGDFDVDLTQTSNWELAISRNKSLNADFLAWFAEQFHFEGCLSETAFRDNMHWLCSRIPADKQLILLNATEIPLEHEYQHDRYAHHQRMNAILAEVIDSWPQVDLCDVRQFANSPADVTDNIRHYRRGVYYNIAGELRELIARRWPRKRYALVELAQGSFARLSALGRSALWSAVKRIRGRKKGRH